MICSELSGRPVEWAPLAHANLVAAGSLLGQHIAPPEVWAAYSGAIWGTGCMWPGQGVDLRRADVRALRGSMTLSQVQRSATSPVPFGDPGLLADRLLGLRPAPTTLLGVIPHWAERGHPFYRSPLLQSPDVRLVNPLDPAEEVLRQIAGCRHILSSSLHGLIAADALGIPNRWLRLNHGQEDRAGAPVFKFQDYYSALGLPQTPRPLNAASGDSLDALLPEFENGQRPDLGSVRTGLEDSFPRE
jgi:hypothetical protein